MRLRGLKLKRELKKINIIKLDLSTMKFFHFKCFG